MKHHILTLILAGSISTLAVAQDGIETDDIYFNSKDRKKVNEKLAHAALARYKQADEQAADHITLNPTDSYSARNINPEYSAQDYGEQVPAGEEQNYFLPNYQPSAVNQNLSYQNSKSWNNWGYNPGWGYGYNGFNSFSPYSYRWNDPFWGYPYSGYSPGWSLSMTYGFGGWNSWCGFNYGWNSWSPWNSYYGSGWGGYYGRPTVIIVNTNENSHIAYGKRPSRSSQLNNVVDRSRGTHTIDRTDAITSGRTRTEGAVYYDRSWRRNSNDSGNTRSYWSSSNSRPDNTNSGSRYDNASDNNSRSRLDNWNNNSNNDVGRQRSSSFSSPTRSSSGASSGSGTRSSSSGNTRGRNNN